METFSESICRGATTARIICPASLEKSGTRRFPLLLTLGALNAEVCAETLARLNTEGVLPEMIVAQITPTDGGIDEIVGDLQGKLRLLDAPAARWIVGTGHQAVHAFRAVLDYPTLCGKAACLSTSFEGIEGAPPLHSRILHDLEERGTLSTQSRLYFDYGTVGLDECYEPYHRDLGAILRNKGGRDGVEFQIVRSAGGSHDKVSWNTRLDPALRWLAGS